MKCSKWAEERTVEKSIKRLGNVAPSKVLLRHKAKHIFTRDRPIVRFSQRF